MCSLIEHIEREIREREAERQTADPEKSAEPNSNQATPHGGPFSCPKGAEHEPTNFQ